MAAQFNQEQSPNDDKNYVIVAAIDFGTTHSGYAFSTIYSPDQIVMNKNWGAEFSCTSYKTPTCVLTNAKGEFVSFGYAAENDFCVKTEANESGYNMYRHFKMMLHKDEITINSQIVSTAGQPRAAVDIFVMALKQLKEDIMKAIKNAKIISMEDDMIRWVLTVPAIWKDKAKHFMREAAFRAGLIDKLESRQLLIALEPEAASMYCRGLEVNLWQGGREESREVHFQDGEQYIIVDAGGGTVDITAHEIQANGKVKEIYPPAGAPLGGISVDKNFEMLLSEILGKEFVAEFKSNCPQDWMRLMLLFEKAKMVFNPDESKSINIQLSYTLGAVYSEKTNMEIDDAINQKKNLGVKFENGSLIVSCEKAKELFAPVTEGIVTKVADILGDPRLQNVENILLVGGFGQCSLLQEEVKRKFGESKAILIPTDAQLAIIRGAVKFGHDPRNITMRIARLTYGFAIAKRFIEGVHNEKYKFTSFGEEMCNHLFDMVIKKNREIETGTNIEYDLRATEIGMNAGYSTITIFNTAMDNVTYTDEEGMQKLATIKVHHSQDQVRAQIALHFTIGGTELFVKAKDKNTNQWVETTVDFLSD